MRLGVSRRFAVSSVLAVACLVYPAAAHATFTLKLHESGFVDQTFTFVPAPGNPLPGAPQILGVVEPFGGFNVVVEVASSNSNLPSQFPTLTLNHLQVTGSAGAQTLQITVEDTGFSNASTGPGPVVMVSQLSDTQLPLGSSLTYQSYLNGTPSALLSLGTVGGVQDSTGVATATNPFDLKSVMTISIAGPGVVQGTGITQVMTPEPGTLGALFSAVPLFGLGLWWRRRATV